MRLHILYYPHSLFILPMLAIGNDGSFFIDLAWLNFGIQLDFSHED